MIERKKETAVKTKIVCDGADIRKGLPRPPGATWDGKGVNFAMFSAHATRVEVYLFDKSGKRQTCCRPATMR
jgi:isoamylase